jgi:hypothetical protein
MNLIPEVSTEVKLVIRDAQLNAQRSVHAV